MRVILSSTITSVARAEVDRLKVRVERAQRRIKKWTAAFVEATTEASKSENAKVSGPAKREAKSLAVKLDEEEKRLQRLVELVEHLANGGAIL